MKRTIFAVALMAMFIFSCTTVSSKKIEATYITDGVLTYSPSHYYGEKVVIPLGFDAYGYNYNAHMFKGSFYNSYAGNAGLAPYFGNDEAYLKENPEAAKHWAWEYRDIKLIMKWNDAWLANFDADKDGKLDRHYGYKTYIGSGAWMTNHQFGEDKEGKWTYFTKIVAAPEDAKNSEGIWYNPDGIEIGSAIWGSFATILSVESGSGAYYKSLTCTGFGYYQP